MTAATTTRAEYEARLRAEADKVRGVRFLHNGRSPSQGLDCLGLVVWVQRAAGVADFPDTEKLFPSNWHQHAQQELYLEGALRAGAEVPPEALRPGDCVLFRLGMVFPHAGTRRIQHIGLVLSAEPGRTRFLQAIAGRGTHEATLQDRAWTRALACCFRAHAVARHLGEER